LKAEIHEFVDHLAAAGRSKPMPFEPSTRVCVKTAPEKVGTITGKTRERAGRVRYEVDFGTERDYFLESALEPVAAQLDIFDLLERGRYASVATLRSTITHTRLTGKLADVIYSMETSNTEFFAYQFKPVLNFLDSPSKGILIADEVGLGKTIEAGLIWTELRARLDASKLLVLCPAVLREKWQEELATRFGVRAEIYNARELHKLLQRANSNEIDGFAAIVSMQGARPPRRWEDNEDHKSGAAQLARYLSALEPGQPLFDCVVIDEAHYLRNPDTQIHTLARLARDVSEYLVLLSATPIHLRNEDLFHLLSLIDSENFRYSHAFNDVLKANAPLIQLGDKLRRKVLEQSEFLEHLQACRTHSMLAANRQLKHLLNHPPAAAELADPSHRDRLADKIERVNLLARVVSRTRKRDVQTDRVVRDAVAPTVEMTEAERTFYDEVTERVRSYCMASDLSEGFILTIPQRQMCSSIPAAYRAWTRGDTSADPTTLYESGLVTESDAKSTHSPLVSELATVVKEIATFSELKQDDSKYKILLKHLRDYWKDYPSKKVILFAYYRETLKYLYERLQEDQISSVLLMGGMRESKQSVIDQFKTDANAKILLASEVASEGVDLQFSSFLINYDLPWNPMRVEQRIGRIDRIGQTEDRIHIWNLFYGKTLDERIYQRLFERLGIFRQAFGDIEAVLGDQVNELTHYLFSHRLTPEQEAARIEQSRIAIAQTARQQEELEEEAAHLAAHGDYVLNQVKAARQMRRYIDAETLWNYVRDALMEDYPGTEMVRIEDDPLTADLALSQAARVDLHHFVERHRLKGKTRLFSATPEKRMRCVFSSKVNFATAAYEVINQHHPLVRFVRSRVDQTSFHPLVAGRLAPTDAAGVSNGTYLVTTQMWSTSGARTLEKFVFKGIDLETGTPLSDEQSERLVNTAAHCGVDWGASRSAIDGARAVDRYESLLDQLDDEFADYAAHMKMENNDRIDHLIRTLTDKVRSQIAQEDLIISRLSYEGKTRTIPARKGKIKKLEEYLEVQRGLHEKKRTISTEQRNVITVALYVGTN
jgi:hypothetical protein